MLPTTTVACLANRAIRSRRLWLPGCAPSGSLDTLALQLTARKTSTELYVQEETPRAKATATFVRSPWSKCRNDLASDNRPVIILKYLAYLNRAMPPIAKLIIHGRVCWDDSHKMSTTPTRTHFLDRQARLQKTAD